MPGNVVDPSSPLEQMIQQQVIDRGLSNPRLLEALRSVRRDRFFVEELASEAYADRAAPIGHGQTISQPYIVALMTDRLDVAPNHRVLEIGTGSGYQTAILAHLAQEVFTVERVKPLLDEAFNRLGELGLRNVHFRYGDGTLGCADRAPFDRILIAAGAPAVPEKLLREQLADGGLAVLPVGPAQEQMLLKIRRNGTGLESETICGCRFVRLIGQEGWKEGEGVRG